jgi:formate dehydrogenase maturation protein FdhE
VRFQGEDKEEGYLISACRACHAYLKEIDRRVRWNAASALVEDWGSPHLDVFAHRSGYGRAVPTLIELERAVRARA